MIHSEKKSINGKCRCAECVEALASLMDELPNGNGMKKFINEEMGINTALHTNYGNQRPREPICGWCDVGTVRFTGAYASLPYACVATQWTWNARHTVLGYCGLNYKNLADARQA